MSIERGEVDHFGVGGSNCSGRFRELRVGADVSDSRIEARGWQFLMDDRTSDPKRDVIPQVTSRPLTGTTGKEISKRRRRMLGAENP
jgi:hypothetical protein